MTDKRWSWTVALAMIGLGLGVTLIEWLVYHPM